MFKARSVRRKRIEARWDDKQVASIMGTPWKPYNFTESDKLKIALPKMPDPPEPAGSEADDDPAPKRVRIEKRDLERLGYTPSCPGCYSAKNNRPHRSHTDHCRSRIQRAMAEDPLLRRRIEAAEEREKPG